MTITDTNTAPPDYRAMTEDELAALYETDEGAFAAVAAELDRRDRAARMAKARNRLGEIRGEGDSAAFAQYLEADAACRGNLLSKAGKAAGITDEQVLWRLPEDQAQRYASEELRDHWLYAGPRITSGTYVRQQAAQSRTARAEARHATDEGGNGDEELAGNESWAFRREPATPQASQAGGGGPVRGGGRGPGESEGGEGTGGTGGPGGPVRRDGMPVSGEGDIAPGAMRRMPLDEARKFGGEIWWTKDVQLDVLTAALAATHTLHSFNTMFRLLVRSKEKRTGKTTASDLAELLGSSPWRATSSSPHGIKAKFKEADPPLIIVEEIQKRFGTNGLAGSRDPLATVLLDGYRRTATTPLSVDRTTVDVPSYCAAFLNGRGKAVHDDIEDRCIVLAAERKPAGITMPRNSLDSDTWAEGSRLRDALHAYVKNLEPVIADLQRKWRPPHPLFVDRLDQIWRSLYLTALASDIYERDLWEKACATAAEQGTPEPPRPACDWAERIMSGFRLLALDNSDIPPLLNEQIALRDAARWFRSGGGWKDQLGRRFGFASDMKDWLVRESGEPLWAELTERAMERLFTEALGETQVLTCNSPGEAKRRARGWAADPVLRGWDALEASFLPALPDMAEEFSIFDDLPPEEDGEADHSGHSTDSH